MSLPDLFNFTIRDRRNDVVTLKWDGEDFWISQGSDSVLISCTRAQAIALSYVFVTIGKGKTNE